MLTFYCFSLTNLSTNWLCKRIGMETNHLLWSSETVNTVFDLISEHALVSGHPPFFEKKKIYIYIYIIIFYFNMNNYFK